MQNHYKDVIEWLENSAIKDPDSTDRMITHNINIVAMAFSKPYEYVDRLIHKQSHDNLTKEEKKIFEFYFGLYRKRMNDYNI